MQGAIGFYLKDLLFNQVIPAAQARQERGGLLKFDKSTQDSRKRYKWGLR